MAYTVSQLVTGAFYGSGVVSRDLDTVGGSQMNDGIIWLNDILQEKVVDQDMIPYETTYNFNLVAGQESYTIPNLIDINTFTFNIDDVRYSVRRIKRDEYKGSSRVDNIQSLPFQWNIERNLGGAILSVYFAPDKNYAAEINGIFRLNNVALGDDLELIIDRFYITYLRYELIDRICAEYAIDTPMGAVKQLGKYQDMISANSRPVDLRIQSISTLSDRGTMGWAFVNFNTGFLP